MPGYAISAGKEPDVLHDPSKDFRVVHVMGLDLMDSTVGRALDWLMDRVERGTRTRVAFPNAHCCNVACRNPDYRASLASADALLPDGSGLSIAARMTGTRLSANLNGTDVVPLLCGRLAASGRSVFMLGGRPGVADEAARRLVADHPGLRIAGTRDGYFGEEENAGVMDRVNSSRADVLLVAMGVPVQDVWLEHHADSLRPTLVMGVGGLFDFVSGRISRAPAGLRRTGTEWIWRLIQEPRRMWRRYILGNPLFLAHAACHAVFGRLPGRPTPYAAAKRAFDVTAASILIVLHALPLFVLGLAVKMGSPGPALIRQTRIGLDGTPFTMLKLRSMYVDAPKVREHLESENVHGSDGVTFKIKRDPRVTPLGRILRRTSFDELPQIWNVLRGDMSLVGPRPQLPTEVDRYERRHFPRLAAKPGLTCLWQITGRSDIPFEEQCALDIEYIRTRSFTEDIRIMLMTVPAVLRARGAY